MDTLRTASGSRQRRGALCRCHHTMRIALTLLVESLIVSRRPRQAPRCEAQGGGGAGGGGGVGRAVGGVARASASVLQRRVQPRRARGHSKQTRRPTGVGWHDSLGRNWLESCPIDS